jgi:hypothetical protein
MNVMNIAALRTPSLAPPASFHVLFPASLPKPCYP